LTRKVDVSVYGPACGLRSPTCARWTVSTAAGRVWLRCTPSRRCYALPGAHCA